MRRANVAVQEKVWRKAILGAKILKSPTFGANWISLGGVTRPDKGDFDKIAKNRRWATYPAVSEKNTGGRRHKTYPAVREKA